MLESVVEPRVTFLDHIFSRGRRVNSFYVKYFVFFSRYERAVRLQCYIFSIPFF